MILQDATTRQLQEAAAYNHSELFRLEAATLGGSILSSGGLTWTQVGSAAGSMIPFPNLPDDTAGEHLDRLVASYLQHPPKGAGCWSLDPSQPADLGVRLLARGFQPGWKPCWMALDLFRMSTDYPMPKGLTITLDNRSSLNDVSNLPYAGVIIPSLPPGQAGCWARFVARLRGKVLAHSVVFLTTGEQGAAGIYHVGVVPRARGKGIGKAVTAAACRYAREQGYRYAVLNATGEGRRIYEQMGFTHLGDGRTWWLITERFLEQPPQPSRVLLAEAVGRGDVTALDNLRKLGQAQELDRPLTNGMTLMQLAVYCQQPASAGWLADSGISFSPLDAWDLEWKDRAERLLRDHPEQVDRQYSDLQLTLLHIAAERNDTDLARLALSARPNLFLRDSIHQATALDWARFFKRESIIQLIENWLPSTTDRR